MTKKSVSFADDKVVQTYVLSLDEKIEKRTYHRKLGAVIKRRMTMMRKNMTKEDYMQRAARRLNRISKLKILNKK